MCDSSAENSLEADSREKINLRNTTNHNDTKIDLIRIFVNEGLVPIYSKLKNFNNKNEFFLLLVPKGFLPTYL